MNVLRICQILEIFRRLETSGLLLFESCPQMKIKMMVMVMMMVMMMVLILMVMMVMV